MKARALSAALGSLNMNSTPADGTRVNVEAVGAAYELDEHFRRVKLAVCFDVASASPAAFDAWRQSLSYVQGKR